MAQSKPIEDVKKLFEGDSDTLLSETPDELLESTRRKLYTMFCSPMEEEYIHEAFEWIAHLCMAVGDRFWSSGDGWTEEDAKIFSCIARLSMTEIYILIPLVQRHITSDDQEESEDGKILARSANSSDYNKFGNHLVILESVIKCLLDGQRLDEEKKDTLRFSKNLLTDFLRGDELKTLLDRLRDAMNSICEYLEQVHIHWQELIEIRDSEKFACAEAALRIMTVWLSDDPESFEPQCKRFVIELLINNLLLVDRPSKDDLLILALHSICTQNEDLLRVLKGIPKHEEALEKYLNFVQREQAKITGFDKREKKLFKLRCGLIKDLLIDSKT